MKRREDTVFRTGDAVVIALVIVAALAILLTVTFYGGSGENLKVEIWKNGEKMQELSLQKNTVVKVEGEYINEITVMDGRVAITDSNCPGKDCVHSGWIGRNGRSVVCLPNRVEVRITGGSFEENDVDAVVQ